MNISRAVAAGFIGGIIIDLFLIIARAVPFPGVYQFIASTLVGPVAFTSGLYIALGLVMHFFISIAFALGFAFVASRFRAVLDQPLAWGVIFGLAAYAVMEIVLALAHAAQPPSVKGIVISLIAHVVFFGLPVALYIARAGKRQALAI
jgi:hypothetical protein